MGTSDCANIIKANSYMTTFKRVKAMDFFERPTPALLNALHHSEQLLEAFFSENPHSPFHRKITLTDTFLAISEERDGEWEPILLLELTQAIRFQANSLPAEIKSKTPVLPCFILINSQQQALRIYLQYSALLELWLLRLSTLLNRVGFHEEFRVVGKIGRGSTSTVYRVERLADGRPMAAKVFLKSFLEEKPQRKESVFQEISLLRAMEHQNILKIHSVYESSSALYVLTDLLEGGTLIERLNAAKRFSLNQVKQIMVGIAQGLRYMHSLGVMHRDIKMENIMFRSKDTFDAVIVDFGLATISEEEPYLFYRCGTPGYIAPQIITMEGNQRTNVGCDIFSAGVIFHVLLTNRFLFQGQNNQEVYRSNKSLSFDLESEQYSCYDAQAMDLMTSMLEIEEAHRITAEDVVLHDFLSDIRLSSREKEEVSPAVTSLGEELYNF